MYVYVVAIQPRGFLWEKISQECYYTLMDAQIFIESRADNPIQITEFKYESLTNNYNIYELKVKE